MGKPKNAATDAVKIVVFIPMRKSFGIRGLICLENLVVGVRKACAKLSVHVNIWRDLKIASSPLDISFFTGIQDDAHCEFVFLRFDGRIFMFSVMCLLLWTNFRHPWLH